MNKRELFHRLIFFIALMLMLIGIPFCRPFMSIGGIVLVVNWFLEGRFREKWNILISNRFLFVSLWIFLVYGLWLLFTDNYTLAWNDIWMKTPLLFMPIILATSRPLSVNEFHNLLKVYLIGVLISTIYGFSMYHLQAWSDKREIAVFISYIRFEMNLCFAVFVCMYVFFHDKKMQWQRFVLLLSLGWLIFLILYIGALTAIVMLVVVLSALLIKKAVENRRKRYRLVYSTVLVLILGAISVYTFIIVKQYYTVNFDIKTADKLSPDGNPYRHHIENGLIENGSYVFSYVCKQELVSAWEKRSDLPFDGCDIYGQHKIENTLIRYLNSKGLRKDRIGVETLKDEDITHIEQGIANVVYANRMGLKSRIYSLLWELSDYRAYGTVSGYTLPQRFELWKNALCLVEKHPVFGVGTGDVKEAFAAQLGVSDSPLKDSNKLSHNQFLLFLISFGTLGLLLILISFFYPFLASRRFKNDLFFIFFVIVISAMMTDDTFERQDGLTFFAFFNAFFLFLMPFKADE